MLEIRDLTVAYQDRLALKNVSFQARAGAFTALVGPNGAGKTTLVRAISGVAPISSGEIRIQGKDLRHIAPAERARLVAVVPQARNLPPAFTALETVALGRTPHLNWLGQASAADHQRVEQAMERTCTLELANRRVSDLSGGEQQRLLLARALAQEAPLLLLDEPTTHLDLQYQIGLLDQVYRLVRQEGITVVAVLHDLNLVLRYAQQVALLVHGELRAFGNPEQVLDPDLLSQVYHIPLQRHAAPGGGSVILPAAM